MNSVPSPAKRPVFLNWLGMLLLIAFALAGCGRDNVKVYRLSNDDSSSPAPPPNSTTAAPAPGPNDNNAAQPQLQWTLPSGWTQVAASAMSIASFHASGPNGAQAEVSVVPLPGNAGGDTANVNRWRGQLGLPAATADELQKMGEAIQVGDQSATLYDIVGSDNAKRILGTIHEHSGTTWFFKMTGDAGLVEQQKPEFTAFLKSLTFSAASTAEALPPGHPAIGGADQTAPMMSAEAAGGGKPVWTIPSDWQDSTPGAISRGRIFHRRCEWREGGSECGSVERQRWRRAGQCKSLARTNRPGPGGRNRPGQTDGDPGRDGRPGDLGGYDRQRHVRPVHPARRRHRARWATKRGFTN